MCVFGDDTAGRLGSRTQAVATTPRSAAYALLGTDTALISRLVFSESRSPYDSAPPIARVNPSDGGRKLRCRAPKRKWFARAGSSPRHARTGTSCAAQNVLV